MVPLWFGRWASALLDLVDLKPGEAVLDVACGTGVTTRLAKRAVGKNGQVIGLDINSGMLEMAKRLAPDADIAWTESDVVGIRLPSQSVTAVISQHGYHYFPDKPVALREFFRLLRPSGRLAMSIWDGHSVYTQALCIAVEKHISSDIAEKQRSQRVTPSDRDLISDLAAAGFRDVEVRRQELMIDVPHAEEFVPLHLGSMPIADAFHALDQAAQHALISDVSAALSGYTVGGRLIYPDAVNVVLGVK
ncbi:methyltransferase domain-containing protein [Marivita sp. S2033]|uniref:methyltransferase domain-containing protein n=1 Tax=Marivita sp. S2033 TaxID=3373187 RepID=UPI003982CCAE